MKYLFSDFTVFIHICIFFRNYSFLANPSFWLESKIIVSSHLKTFGSNHCCQSWYPWFPCDLAPLGVSKYLSVVRYITASSYKQVLETRIEFSCLSLIIESSLSNLPSSIFTKLLRTHCSASPKHMSSLLV